MCTKSCARHSRFSPTIAKRRFAMPRSARLESQGCTPPFRDGQIAAIAMVDDLILVTRNTRDFENFTDLRYENWFT